MHFAIAKASPILSDGDAGVRFKFMKLAILDRLKSDALNMKLKQHIVSLKISPLIVICLTNTTSYAFSLNDFLTPPTEQELYNEEVSQLLSEKVEEIHAELNDKLPFYGDNKFDYFTNDKVERISSFLKNAGKSQSILFEKNKDNMKQNRKIIGIFSATNKDLNATISKIDSIFNSHTTEFKNIYGRGLALDIGDYCKSVIIPESLCNNNHGRRLPESAEVLVPMLIKKKLFEAYPIYEKYYNVLHVVVAELASTARTIAAYSTSYEHKLYLKEASKNTGNKLTKFGSDDGVLLSIQLGYTNFRPDNKTIYDLYNFKVMQSIKGGILLTPNKSARYSNARSVIFVKTSAVLTDNHIFRKGDANVCLSGIKDYTSILGVNKKVYSFKVVPKTNTTYYFIKN
jgi:hypothetical protein